MINNLYKELSHTDVHLNEEHHIYINKQTGHFYNSVTGVLSLIKNEFDAEDAIGGIQRQYQTFIDWHETIGGKKKDLIEHLTLYVNYRQFTPKEMKVWEGRQYEGYIYGLKDYQSLNDFISEYHFLRTVNQIERKKNIYLTSDFKIMSKSAIQEMWRDMTDIANHYGNIVHLTMERNILEFQNILDPYNDHLLAQIQEHFFWIKKHLPIFYAKYPNSNHSFEEYEIDCTLGELMSHVIEQFYKVHKFVGRCVVPEKRLLYRGLAGTKDIHEDIDGYLFNTGDHKTNKDFTVTSKYGANLLKPMDAFEDTELNLYTFQLSIYTFMVEQLYNKKANDLYITYYNRKFGKFKKFEIKYLKHEAAILIDLYVDWIEERKRRYRESTLGEIIAAQIKPEWEDHFSKAFYYHIKETKKNGNTERENYIKFIDDYCVKYRGVVI